MSKNVALCVICGLPKEKCPSWSLQDGDSRSLEPRGAIGGQVDKETDLGALTTEALKTLINELYSDEVLSLSQHEDLMSIFRKRTR